MSEQNDLAAKLAAPFESDEVKWKPQATRGNRALAICYVDARTVMDRLDDVLGLGKWQTSYQTVQDGVICRLRVWVGSEWVTHEDVGSFSEQPDDGDKLKSAFSDSLKRAAVHLGVGRYLYRLPHQWVDWDPEKKQFVRPPRLPDWALPAKPAPQKVAPLCAKPETLAKLHRAIERADRTWEGALKWLGVDQPQGWEPPEDEGQARKVDLLTEDQCRRVLEYLEPKTKPAAKAS